MSFVAKFVGKLTGAQAQADAAQEAGRTQSAAAQAGVDQLNGRFDDAKTLQMQQLDAYRQALAPYMSAGTGALSGVQDLTGLNGAGAQQSAIAGIQGSPQYQALSQSGQDAILSNASATGGLRGGNVQAALGQFQPQLLSQLIDQQLSRLGGLTSLGANSSLNYGNAGISTGNAIAQEGLSTGANVANLLQQKAAATAGGQLAEGSVARQGFGDALKIASLFMGGAPGAPDAAPTAAAARSNPPPVAPGLGASLFGDNTPGSITNFAPSQTLPNIQLPFLSSF